MENQNSQSSPVTSTPPVTSAPAAPSAKSEKKPAPKQASAPKKVEPAPTPRKARTVKYLRSQMVIFKENGKDRGGIVVNDTDQAKIVVLTSKGTVTKSAEQLAKYASPNPVKWVDWMSKVEESVVGKPMHDLIVAAAGDEKATPKDKSVKIGTYMFGYNWAKQYAPKDAPVLKKGK